MMSARWQTSGDLHTELDIVGSTRSGRPGRVSLDDQATEDVALIAQPLDGPVVVLQWPAGLDPSVSSADYATDPCLDPPGSTEQPSMKQPILEMVVDLYHGSIGCSAEYLVAPEGVHTGIHHIAVLTYQRPSTGTVSIIDADGR